MEAVVESSLPAVPRGSGPCRGLLEVAPYVIKDMRLCDVKALRATCCEGRAIADATVSSLAVDYVQQDVQLPETHGSGGRSRGAAVGVPTVGGFAAFVRGIHSRGARPKALDLHPSIVGGGPGAGERLDTSENENAA